MDNQIKQRHYHSSNIPKGSYHTYCRNRLAELYQLRVNPNSGQVETVGRGNSRSFHSHRSQHHNQNTPINEAQTFEEYLEKFQRPATTVNLTTRHPSSSYNTRNHYQKDSNREESKVKSKENLKKVDNEEIVDSQLPFFKCRLEKTEFLLKRPDFRVKENKFKVRRNVVETNLLNFFNPDC